MLEKIDFGKKDLSKQDYKEQHDVLVERLVVLQQLARQYGVGMVVLFEGWNGAGKGERISDLMFNLDARSTTVHSTPDLDVDELADFPGTVNGVTGYYPFMQQFWKALGERSTITFFDCGWYTAANQQVLFNSYADLFMPSKKEREEAERAMSHSCMHSINDFERQIYDDGYMVVKFFVHVSEEGQRKHLLELYEDPRTAWRVDPKKLSLAGSYDEQYKVYDEMLEESNFDYAPWTLINGENKRTANIQIALTMIDALERALTAKGVDVPEAPATDIDGDRKSKVKIIRDKHTGTIDELAHCHKHHGHSNCEFETVENPPSAYDIDYTLKLDPEEYRTERKCLQNKLYKLENLMYQERIPMILMYEGYDAAGKGGNIKRVAQALDARSYTIFTSPAPTATDLAHPHLWRYWTRLPKAGHVGIYDRSWYGRVLVERVEGFADADEVERAYDELNAFERDLVEWGAIILKFWVDISPEEQLRRFEERQNTPSKQWKITEEDWRNREKYPQYKEAVEDMFKRTSTTFAPWTILESENKLYARIKGLRIIVDALEKRLGVTPDDYLDSEDRDAIAQEADDDAICSCEYHRESAAEADAAEAVTEPASEQGCRMETAE